MPFFEFQKLVIAFISVYLYMLDLIYTPENPFEKEPKSSGNGGGYDR